MMNHLFFLILFCFLQLTGCGQKEESPVASKPLEKTEVEKVDFATLDLSQAGSIQGEILFEGEDPTPRKLKIAGNPECSMMAHGTLFAEDLLVKEGKLENTVVYIKQGLEPYQFPVPQEVEKLGQVNCTFIPHVIGVQAGQKIEISNSDPTLHNVNARAKNSRGFNIGFPTKGMKVKKSFKKSEVAVPIRCDLHPWMKGYIAIFDHPYFQITGKDGKFSFSKLPPGKYLIEAWHENLGSQTQTIELSLNQSAKTSFTFFPLKK